MTRADRLTLVRQLAEEGLSQRAIAKRLKISKDTVRRDLERITAEAEPGDEPPAEPETGDEPQVAEAVDVGSAPQGAPPAEPQAPVAELWDAPLDEPDEPDAPPSEPVAHLPRRVAHPRLEMDLDGRPAMRRDLAVLAQSGRTVEQLVSQAVIALAFGYRQALARGDLLPGETFLVTELTVKPAPRPAARTAAAGRA
ncbi:helix-turn-helix domain-containing protein [Streptomyces pseudovenezuelae]|uniref:helix-turn-helix domain-containing protein n=1 Tax=Streptomyces pseudovenezuelae TaxID=67350 RepID=UPI002E36F5B6|nr:helix-turn-helix domain-containing protein [Streptomyces pseudovenezuelae]